jgi:site-specific DNA-cytosine methylase
LRRLNRADRPRCHICAHANANADATDLCLPSIDLYAGGGGSILGAREHFDMRHAVETDPVCIETLRDARNRELYFPNLRVHACPVGELRERGLTPRRAALMFAGPPCQGHSRANHMRNAGDVRNDEIGVTLGEVERLRTAVVVIENVPGIKDLTTDGRNFALDIVARLLALGYQVRVGTVNAAHYGSAQVRHRLFFLAAQRGLPLPPFPRPTHASSLRSTNISIDGKAHSWSHSYSGAAFPMVDAKAAVHDLPLWGYGTRGDGRAYDPAQDGVGVQPARYRSKPLNDFQQRMRQGHGAEELQDHITGRRSERELDLINGAPSARDVDAGVEGTCRRTHPHDQVMTLLTSSRPGGKGTAPIHWACHRTFTVAERKRFTGMPDAYQLHGTPEDKDRLTGNAINVAVAEALAREIKTAVFTKAWREQGKPSSSAFWRSWRAAHPI